VGADHVIELVGGNGPRGHRELRPGLALDDGHEVGEALVGDPAPGVQLLLEPIPQGLWAERFLDEVGESLVHALVEDARHREAEGEQGLVQIEFGCESRPDPQKVWCPRYTATPVRRTHTRSKA